MSSEDEDMDYHGYQPDSFDGVFKTSNTYAPQSLPPESNARYNKIYEYFHNWNETHDLGARPISQNLLIEYFEDVAMRSKPTTLWAYYSMLKATLRWNDDIDISNWSKLTDYLKRQSIGYKPVKSKVFTQEEIDKFINEAPDDYWLDVKVACIFAVSSAYTTSRLVNVMTEHIKEYDDLYLVTIPKTEASPPRTFTVSGPFFKVAQKYASLRTANVKHKRFSVHYHEGKCAVNPIGKNKFNKMPQRMARYLKLPDPERYTAHSFRTSSVGSVANEGGYTLNTPAEEAMQQENGDPKISLDSETGLLITSSNRVTKAAPTAAINTNNTTNEHVCTVKCGQVKCAKEEHEKSASHAFTLMKPPDYAITEVSPAVFSSDPICRWIVAYSHFIEPISAYSAEEKFEDITRSIPNNVMVVDKYIRKKSSQLFAAYVVVYGVRCLCLKDNFEPNLPQPVAKFRKNNHNSLSAERSVILWKENFDPLSGEIEEYAVSEIKYED